MIEFQELSTIIEEIITKGEFKEYSNLTELDNQGIYIVKKKEGDIIYVGSAPKQSLRQRLMKGHLEGKNTALTRKVPKLYGKKQYSKEEYLKLSKEEKKKVASYLKENCLFLTKPLNDFDKVLAVEHILIFLLRKKFDLLNDTIDKFK